MVHHPAVEIGGRVLVPHQAEADFDGGDLVGSGQELDLDVGVGRLHCLDARVRETILLGGDFQPQVLARGQCGFEGFWHGPGIVLLHGPLHPFIRADGPGGAHADQHRLNASRNEKQSHQQPNQP